MSLSKISPVIYTTNTTSYCTDEILNCFSHHNRSLDDRLKFTKVKAAMQKLYFLFFNQDHTNNSTKVMAEGCKFRVAAPKLAQYI